MCPSRSRISRSREPVDVPAPESPTTDRLGRQPLTLPIEADERPSTLSYAALQVRREQSVDPTATSPAVAELPHPLPEQSKPAPERHCLATFSSWRAGHGPRAMSAPRRHHPAPQLRTRPTTFRRPNLRVHSPRSSGRPVLAGPPLSAVPSPPPRHPGPRAGARRPPFWRRRGLRLRRWASAFSPSTERPVEGPRWASSPRPLIRPASSAAHADAPPPAPSHHPPSPPAPGAMRTAERHRPAPPSPRVSPPPSRPSQPRGRAPTPPLRSRCDTPAAGVFDCSGCLRLWCHARAYTAARCIQPHDGGASAAERTGASGPAHRPCRRMWWLDA